MKSVRSDLNSTTLLEHPGRNLATFTVVAREHGNVLNLPQFSWPFLETNELIRLSKKKKEKKKAKRKKRNHLSPPFSRPRCQSSFPSPLRPPTTSPETRKTHPARVNPSPFISLANRTAIKGEHCNRPPPQRRATQPGMEMLERRHPGTSNLRTAGKSVKREPGRRQRLNNKPVYFHRRGIHTISARAVVVKVNCDYVNSPNIFHYPNGGEYRVRRGGRASSLGKCRFETTRARTIQSRDSATFTSDRQPREGKGVQA